MLPTHRSILIATILGVSGCFAWNGPAVPAVRRWNDEPCACLPSIAQATYANGRG